MNRKRLLPLLALCLAAAAAAVPWEDLTPADWLYALSTRFTLVEGHQVHYPTPTAELAKALAASSQTDALRQLADARLALGDRKGALDALQSWAQKTGSGEAWAEAARWAQSHAELAAAFQDAERALPGLSEDARRDLASERIDWAEQHPDLADPMALRQARAALFPQDGAYLEEWVRALEKARRLDEAGKALAASSALSPERRLLLRADLLSDHGDHHGAFLALDAAADQAWSPDFRRAYAARVDKGAPAQPAAWRATLESRYDAAALARLAAYFEGKERGDAAAGLLDQMERRYGKDLGRPDQLLLARLRADVDAIPEAFRDTLAAAQQGKGEEQSEDLATLAHLALRAGGRPLPWGSYNDESYRWAANMDRTPGFWTGGLSFFLTGQDWKDALDRLESESLPDRTFAVSRALTDLLAQRAPKSPELPALRAEIMARFVERGEGRQALALLPQVESASPEMADEGRRVALLAARQTDVPLTEEARLYKARLAYAAPKGARPALQSQDDESDQAAADAQHPWARVPRGERPQRYANLLEEAVTRLDFRDPSHRASLDLCLTELDRLPDDEELWLNLASRLEGWRLDDDLGPRLDGALKRFNGAGIWDKAARWYARRNHNTELRALAEDLAGRFRGSALFEKAGAEEVLVDIPEQAQSAHPSLVRWADFVRLKALERFPHSPRVFHEAARLMPAAEWQREWQKPAFRNNETRHPSHRVLVPDELMEERSWAILFVDAGQREAFFADAMRDGSLESKLDAMAAKTDRTPVEDQLLFEGRARLSQFERAMEPADRLAAAYPGDGELAQRVLSLHRSLDGLDGAQAAAARALVERTAPALEDPNALWTELGELQEDRGHPEAAIALWQHLVEREPRNADRVSELATLLWDYNHDKEALSVVEQGRKAMGRPRYFAFETGVLRENLKDLDGAIREYLDALEPEDEYGFGSWFEEDQRSLRRIAQLVARPKVYALVQKRITDLKPGSVEDERALAAFLPMATIETPAPGLDYDADDWMDGMDQPNDPVGRELRAKGTEQARPREHDAIKRLGDLMLAKARDMAPQATAPGFLDAVQSWSRPLIQARWKKPDAVQMENLIQARRAQLAPTEEDRIRQEMARAAYLADNGRGADADALWAQLGTRIGALPEGVTRMRAEAQRAAYLERAKGAPAASQEWQRLAARYPWSLGILEDRVAFLNRAGQGDQARAALEAAIPKAASGHREALLEKLTQDSLAASDLARARRAVDQLLAEEDLDETHRLAAAQLVARLSWRENAAWDPAALIQAQKEKLRPELHADLYHELAMAADLEGVSAKALGLWIEALDRRTGRDWIQAAARATRKAGTAPQLLAFFEKQQKRSPRDVRWAVAVRDLRRDGHDVDGAIAAAQAAVLVRPEEEILWREAADLMVRSDRVEAASDYLAGWNKARAADEGVAGWRSGLYSQAGDGAKALAVEQAALAAFRKASPEAGEELGHRKARAIGRLMDEGHPDLALKLGSARGDIRDLDGVMSPDDQCRLALLTNQLPRLLLDKAGDKDFIQTAASTLRQTGRVEWLESAQAFALQQVLPAGGPDSAALDTWWPLVAGSGLEPQVRLALARQCVASQAGPWQASASMPFLEGAGAARVGRDKWGHMEFRDPDLDWLWAQDLARHDQTEALVAYLQPRWQEVLAMVEGPSPLDAHSSRAAWSYWLDDPQVLDAWARGAANHADTAPMMARLMGDRYHWDRFWAVAARGWATASLVPLLPEASRTAWFRLWEPQGPTDPVLVARRKVVESVSESVARLVMDAPGAADDPLIVKLRGPQTVEAVLSHDRAWTWQEFTPRRNAKGELIETGDDRVTGQGVDAGRVPGALWGERPGEAWFVLEALARYRKGDRTAAYLPLEASQRGAETARALLAVRMARKMGDLPLALELEARGASSRDRAWMAERLSLLCAAGKKDDGAALLRDAVRADQPDMTEASFRWFAAQAEDDALPSPLDLMDPAKPVGPAFLAYLQDRQPDAAPRFRTADPTGYLQALGLRWEARESQLSAEQVRRWMKELWAQSAAPLPRRGSLAKLGPVWPHAVMWLARQDTDRPGALEALQQALTPGADPSRFFARLGDGDDDQILGMRVRLARHEDAEAKALVDAQLARLRQGKALGLVFPVVLPQTADEGEDGGAEAASVPAPDEGDALTAHLRAWLAPFREVQRADAIEAEVRDLLKERRDAGAISPGLWALSFELAPAAERPALARELDEAWFRGDVAPEQAGTLAAALAVSLPSEAQRWLDRWPRHADFQQTAARASVLVALHRAPDAAKAFFEARRVTAWSGLEDLRAFDAWRKAAPATAPAAPSAWRLALPAWQGKASDAAAFLGAHLKDHPADALAARAALRTIAAAPEDAMARARLALPRTGGDEDEEGGGDRDGVILALRSARGLLPGSWRAARSALGDARPEDLASLLAKRKYRSADINDALADTARIAFKGGDDRGVQSALKALQDRHAANAKALRAELAAPAGQVDAYRMVDGRPAPIRPRDLNWTLLANLVKAEAAR
ncbi:MAG TPA: hypothetical protein VL181_03350 [Holophagaceae bacterium]|nr:hypothetical protein [Holophagaceae bacterium]